MLSAGVADMGMRAPAGRGGRTPGPAGGFSEPSSEYVADFMSSAESVQLNRAFTRIQDPKVRRRIVDLVRSLADAEIEDLKDAPVDKEA